ncbi:Transcriptional regulator, AsnC family [[Actinomadura] parvosata subsp. kistnae]|uniref:hypothetical protein n=1 Tax=[Actinomadura] parvosata TaxID=1955412 RepID=UPI000D2D958B|nr:Transcriptional regulator, AsnC family [Actinomadura parvosata subsp. kistnae]
MLGIAVQTLLWMSVAPAHLDRVATTGSTNLMANALCTDPAALHRYLTQGLGLAEAIHTIETASVLRTVKAIGPMTIGGGR